MNTLMAKKKKNYKRIEDMTDEEWEQRKNEVFGERAENYNPEPDPRFTERQDGWTPSGGDYSVAYYYKDGHPCVKEEADAVNIIEYKANGERLNETYALLKP